MAVLNLPEEEIEMDILSRLPVESLLRFRCVSKPSRSLISDPYFVKLHLNRSILSKNCQKIFCSSFPPQSIDYESLLDDKNNDDDNKALVKLDCPLWSRNRIVSVIGSCNGLICYVVDRLNVVIYNPSTRVSKELPQPPSRCHRRTYNYYGFGFDSSDDDYKVVFGFDFAGDAYNSIRFHVFSLRHNSWRRIQDRSWSHLGRFSLCRKENNGIFLNGALHWLLMVPAGIEPIHIQWVIVSFDLSKEVFSEMSLDLSKNACMVSLGAFEECLYACMASLGTSVEMWLMKETGVKASWTKFTTIPCNVDNSWLTPLCFLRNGELLLKIEMSYKNHRKLGSYNTRINGFTKICNCPRSSKVALYVESLV